MMMSIGLSQFHCVNAQKTSLDAFTTWAKVWKVGINPTKTRVLTFTRFNMPQAFLYMDGVELEECFSHKHLGVHQQSDLKWTTHINCLIDQAESKLVIMKYHRFNFPKRALRTMYTAFVRPLLEYASPVWCNPTLGDLQRLEAVNISALRCISEPK